VLVTNFDLPGGKVEVTDWMPARFDGAQAEEFGLGSLCRQITVLEGEVEIGFECAPRFEYGREPAKWENFGQPGCWKAQDGQPFWIHSNAPLQHAGHGLTSRLILRRGDMRFFVMVWGTQHCLKINQKLVEASLRDTIGTWRRWAKQASYQGPYREAVLRSALALKALVYDPTGAMVAAPTMSLPEAIGGPRNWDYRYCWPRDSTFALYGLSLLGYHEEAGRFLEFIAHLAETKPLPLQVCYRVDGGTDLEERELPWLRGYRDSRPVRVGNGAIHQRQLDIYGEVLDAAYTYAKWREGLSPQLWTAMRRLVDYAAGHWNEPDESIWEVRGGPRHFLYSKVMCWVTIDRAVRLCTKYRLPGPVDEWSRLRDHIRAQILEKGYHRGVHAYTQSFGSDVLDASALLLPLVRFTHPREPRMESTIRAIQQKLSRGTLVARYENTEADGVGGPEGSFSICTFWLIDCLTLLGRTDESRDLFERMLTLGSPLGLFSEEIDASTGTMLGNLPQAFTHMALINSAHNLELYPKGVPLAGHHSHS
jgi:GH15 family glucan-1,4-alpha-glucosidase